MPLTERVDQKERGVGREIKYNPWPEVDCQTYREDRRHIF